MNPSYSEVGMFCYETTIFNKLIFIQSPPHVQKKLRKGSEEKDQKQVKLRWEEWRNILRNNLWTSKGRVSGREGVVPKQEYSGTVTL